MIEIYNNPQATVPDYAAMDPLMLHLALTVDDVDRTRAKLLEAGATPVGDVMVTADGDRLAMLRDPWGLEPLVAEVPDRGSALPTVGGRSRLVQAFRRGVRRLHEA